MTRAALLAIDLGTSAIKVLLIDAESGVPIATARRPSGAERSAERGAAEQDPGEWWRAITAATREAIATAESCSGRIEVRAISVCGHGPTLVPVRDDGTAVGDALLWRDDRSAGDAAVLARLLGRSGWLLGELPKARWLLRERPDAAADATWFLSTWDALALRLSGTAVASFWDPARSLTPSDRARLIGSSEAGIDARAMPPEVQPGTYLGPLLASVASDLGVAAAIPVIAGSNDGLAAVLGAGLVRAGVAVDVGGSAGGVAVAVLPDEAMRILAALPGALWSGPAPTPLGDLRILGGAFGGTGRLLDLVVAELLANAAGEGFAGRADLFAAAAALPLGAEGVIARPLSSSNQRSTARDHFDGVNASHRPEHLVRAAIEGGALAVAALLAPARERGLHIDTLRLSGPATGAVGGPLSGSPLAPDEFPQLRADLFELPVEVLRIPEAAAAGAAILAGIGSGTYATISEALDALVRVERTYEPTPARAEQARELLVRYESLRRRDGGVELRADARGE
ncbi:MAG: xylulokinase [Candidatus Limnocylindrus sp.]